MKYDNYLEKVAKNFKTYLEEIFAKHNFEHGLEFEIRVLGNSQ